MPTTVVLPIRNRKRRPWPIAFFDSYVGKKYIMAVSGIMLLGFVVAHMVGNLKMYLGEEQYEHYAEFLRDMGEPIFPRTMLLWILRGGIILAAVAHIHAAYSLTITNRRARRLSYQSPRDYIAANFASRTMRWTGIVVGLFLIYHLSDLTWGGNNPSFTKGDVYGNVVASFERVPVAFFYILANVALGFHLYHGAWSMFQSLGINNPRYNQARRWLASGLAGLIVVGNISFPLAVLFGVVE